MKFMRGIQKLFRTAAFYFPFTPAGTLLCAALFYILGKSYAQKNAYGLYISLIALFLLCLFIILGRIQARRFGGASINWDSTQALYAGREGAFQVLTIPQARSFFFFRVHFRISGKLKLDSSVFLPFFVESNFTGDGSLRVPFSLPVSGLALVRGILLIRDIFGLTRTRFGETMHRHLPVQPRLLTESSRLNLDTMGGFDSKNRQKNADEEKYYMREYIPGDRIRDINWKASSRVNKFITRISPVTQEQTKVLYVDVRTYKQSRVRSLDAVMHLDYMKSRLITFLWNIKKEHEDYSFIVRTGTEDYKIDTVKDIVKLATVLSSLWYSGDRLNFPEEPASNQIFIFTTPFDSGLSLAASHYADFTIHTMTAVSLRKQAERENDTAGDSSRKDHVLFGRPGLYLPQTWMARREILPAGTIRRFGKDSLDTHKLSISLFGKAPVSGGNSH